MFTVAVRTENGDIHRSTKREFTTRESAFAYAADRQSAKRFMHFIVIDLNAKVPEQLSPRAEAMLDLTHVLLSDHDIH